MSWRRLLSTPGVLAGRDGAALDGPSITSRTALMYRRSVPPDEDATPAPAGGTLPQTVVVVGGDLMARARIESAAAAAGARLLKTTPSDLGPTLRSSGCDVLILDLDGGGAELLEAVAAAGREQRLPRRVLGYFSHVDESLRRRAAEAGVTPMPRGRFWRQLPELLAGQA